MVNEKWRPAIGDRVIVKKGARVFSAYFAWPDKGKISARSYTVTVLTCFPYLPSLSYVGGPVVASRWEIRWGGSGGYWRWCDLADVAPFPTPLEQLAALASRR